MEGDEEVQDHYGLSLKYLEASLRNLSEGLHEPAMANGIHALELAMKAALFTVLGGPIKTHNIGGLFGRHFEARLGKDVCRAANRILARYDVPRYPGTEQLDPDDVQADVSFIDDMIRNRIRKIVARHIRETV